MDGKEMQEQLRVLQTQLDTLAASHVDLLKDVKEIVKNTDTAWTLLCAALIFIMQAGFTLFEVGQVRTKNVGNIVFKNLMDTCCSGIGWWSLGWAFAYGGDTFVEEGFETNPFIGNGEFWLKSSGEWPDQRRYARYVFLWAFCATCGTIVSGAVAERINVWAYVGFSAFICMWVYPIASHWIWSSAGWLTPHGRVPEPLLPGFIDFAGSAVVHLVGGVSALVAVIFLGPRIGRFPPKGHVETPDEKRTREREFAPHNRAISTLGLFILWFGWYGFNFGSTMAINNGMAQIAARVAITTTLSPAASGVTAVFLEYFLCRRKWINIDALLNGALAGMVAVTAGCAVIEPELAVATGAVAGCVYVCGARLEEYFRLDDPLQAVPVHLGCGFWGTIATGLFGRDEYVEVLTGHSDSTVGVRVGIQFLGSAVIIVWSAFWAFVFVGGLKWFGVLRVPAHAELVGMDLDEHGSPGVDRYTYVNDVMTDPVFRSWLLKVIKEGKIEDEHHSDTEMRNRGNTRQSADAGEDGGEANGISIDMANLAHPESNFEFTVKSGSAINAEGILVQSSRGCSPAGVTQPVPEIPHRAYGVDPTDTH